MQKERNHNINKKSTARFPFVILKPFIPNLCRMSETILAVPDATQPGMVYHAPHTPQNAESGTIPFLDVKEVDTHPHGVQWGPRCALSSSTPAFRLPAPQPWPASKVALGSMPNSTLETVPVRNLPMQSVAQRYLRRPVKLTSHSAPLNGAANINNSPPSGETLFMGVAIAVLLAANCVAIGTALTNK